MRAIDWAAQHVGVLCRPKTLVWTSLTVPLIGWLGYVMYAKGRAGEGLPSRGEVTRHFRHLEGLVEGASARYRFKVLPATRDDMRRIGELLKRRGLVGDPEKSCMNEKRAADASYSMIWKRHGDKEIQEQSMIDANTGQPVKIVTAFDGNALRVIHKGVGGVQAFLRDPEGPASWHQRVDHTPYHLMLRRRNQLWSTVISSSKAVEITADQIRGQSVFRVSVPVDGPAIVRRDDLVFDNSFRLVRRDRVGFVPGQETQERLIERFDFGDYRLFKDKSGESVWYPCVTNLTCAVGVSDDGEPAAWQRAEIALDSLELNPPVVDSEFVPELPANAMLIDEVSGSDVGKLGRAEVVWRPTERQRSWADRKRWLVGIGLLAVLLFFVGWRVQSRGNLARRQAAGKKVTS